MGRNSKVLIVLFGAVLFSQTCLMAQTYSTPLPTVNDKDVALLRKNLQAEAKSLITKNMQLTDSEAAAFWPLYNQYTAEVRKVNDTRFGLIKQYAQIYKTMTAEQADSMTRLLAELTRPLSVLGFNTSPGSSRRFPVRRRRSLNCSSTGGSTASSMCRSHRSCRRSNPSDGSPSSHCDLNSQCTVDLLGLLTSPWFRIVGAICLRERIGALVGIGTPAFGAAPAICGRHLLVPAMAGIGVVTLILLVSAHVFDYTRAPHKRSLSQRIPWVPGGSPTAHSTARKAEVAFAPKPNKPPESSAMVPGSGTFTSPSVKRSTG